MRVYRFPIVLLLPRRKDIQQVILYLVRFWLVPWFSPCFASYFFISNASIVHPASEVSMARVSIILVGSHSRERMAQTPISVAIMVHSIFIVFSFVAYLSTPDSECSQEIYL